MVLQHKAYRLQYWKRSHEIVWFQVTQGHVGELCMKHALNLPTTEHERTAWIVRITRL